MSTDPFKKIKKFCADKSLSKMHERYLFHKYVEDLQSLIENHEQQHKKAPSDEHEEGFKGTLLSDNTLSTNVRLADDEIKEITDKEVRKVKSKASFVSFSVNVLSGVVASLLFTLLLVVVFTLGQSQFKSWINDMYIDDKKMEEKVKVGE